MKCQLRQSCERRDKLEKSYCCDEYEHEDDVCIAPPLRREERRVGRMLIVKEASHQK